MASTDTRKYGSTTKTRSQVLEALGVVKVATAAQIRALMCPGTADPATVRGGCKDLEAEGLVVSAGRTSRLEADGRRITEKLWSLTPAGLEAAAVVLDRAPREMGGTAKAAAASGAKHAGKVTDTLAGFLQTPPEPTAPVVRKGAVPAPASVRAAVERPPGLGPIAAWSTEVGLPVTGSFAAPGRGSVRADMVFAAPGSRLPLLFVEVDNGTESPPILAEKVARYRKFLARTVTQGGREIVLWRTVWTVPRRSAHPPLAIVFTKKMNPAAMETRMREVARLTEAAWKGRWTGHTAPDGTMDGYRDYDATVPVIVTVLEALERYGPHGPIWWRYGHDGWQTLAAALDDPDDSRAYTTRDENRRAAAQAARQREERAREEERRRREAAAWHCPECGRKTYPDDEWSTGAAPGGLCSVCRSRADHDARQARERAEEHAAPDRETKASGWLGWRGR
ncbi:replication-relaxation family protein [Streptomyces sp. 3211]|uniref:replication-relaxation family protein n=1 Tax=Streptomyces sp. 3211 TaxID=1964449 RepID=UPI0013313A7A|nr:replication-relaxation family protein [Streptomyces sp. 3211]